MAESLVIAGQIELLGAEGGVPSVIPACAGATFTLADPYDFGAPQPVQDLLAGGLLDGERPIGRRSSNRTISLPVKITAPDRGTLAAAREVLLQLCDEDYWELIWTRDGDGLPLVFDCFRALPAQPANQLFEEQQLVSRITVTFPALPYGRSDTPAAVALTAPSQYFDVPLAPVVIDNYGTATNWLGQANTPGGSDASTFEGGISNWVAAGNCAVARSTAQFHSGAASLALTSSAAGNMQAASCAAASVIDNPPTAPTQAMFCLPGDTVTVSGWFRAATAARSCNVGVDFYDASGTQIGATLRGSNVTNTTTGWTQATGAVTAPSGSVWCRQNPQVVSAGAASEVHYYDDAAMNRGPVYSVSDPQQWSSSTVTAISGQKSAKWSRLSNDCPTYDQTLPATVDTTGRAKLTFWLGLATTSTMFATWHAGTAHFAVTLYDNAGGSLSFSDHQKVQASAVDAKPHWQLMTTHIPQGVPAFDYTNVARYSVTIWNLVASTKPQVKGGPTTAIQVLQASAYLCQFQVADTSTGSPVNRGALYQLPGIIGSARSPIQVQAAPGLASFSSTALFTTAGTQNWTAPGGVTVVDKAEVLGASGGSAGAFTGANNQNPGGGSGGGGYARKLAVPVTPATIYHPVVGAAGVHGNTGSGTNNATNGGSSWFIGDSGVTAQGNGGLRGWWGQTAGGGLGGTGIGDVVYPGGDGYQANLFNVSDGGGGGGSASPDAAGHDAPGRSGGGALPGFGGGGRGGGGLAGQTPGSKGTTPGGGAGGGGWGAQAGGGNGADGQPGWAKLTWGATAPASLTSLLLHMPGRDAPPALSPMVTVGNGADTPNGATEYTFPAVGALNARFDGTYTVYLVASAWNTPANSRTVTVQFRQYAYSGATMVTQSLSRTLVPNTDVTNGYVDLGAITLPLQALPAGQATAYFTVTVTSSNTADRFYDVICLDVAGSTVLLNQAGSSVLQNVWLSAPDPNRAIGFLLGSNADLDQSWSLAGAIERMSGEAMAVDPLINNRLLVYGQQGMPSAKVSYVPRWWMDRAS